MDVGGLEVKMAVTSILPDKMTATTSSLPEKRPMTSGLPENMALTSVLPEMTTASVLPEPLGVELTSVAGHQSQLQPVGQFNPGTLFKYL